MTTLHISFSVVVFLVVLALAFDFMNGFHDAANSIATVVSTGVLKPYQAVAWAATFNFLALFMFELKVAATVGKGIVDPTVVDHVVIFGALAGALAWNIITWWSGIPSSSSHALIGGLIGATIAKSGAGSLLGSGITKVALFIVISPTLGFILGSALMLGVSWAFFRSTPRSTDRWFRRLQLASSALYSIGHGSNDAQKTMGIIWLLLIAAGLSSTAEHHPPYWVVLSCYLAIGLGTLFGGWRIVKTMGQKITKLKPVGGFCAEAGGAITLFIASGFGIPVSTTHTITGAIVGVGSSQKFSAVRWGLAGNIVWAWILTIPASAAMAALAWWIGSKFL
ncbi:MAG: inorganic phosphate transporter [Burkholderiaceae bacterium]|nr:inorganic phosphate transporter [Burkholderiaceae bacterium]